jgi:hypothetical protein
MLKPTLCNAKTPNGIVYPNIVTDKMIEPTWPLEVEKEDIETRKKVHKAIQSMVFCFTGGYIGTRKELNDARLALVKALGRQLLGPDSEWEEYC